MRNGYWTLQIHEKALKKHNDPTLGHIPTSETHTHVQATYPPVIGRHFVQKSKLTKK